LKHACLLLNISARLSFLLFLFFGSTENWTQGFKHDKQTTTELHLQPILDHCKTVLHTFFTMEEWKCLNGMLFFI
jgi:hypothetical protein